MIVFACILIEIDTNIVKNLFEPFCDTPCYHFLNMNKAGHVDQHASWFFALATQITDNIRQTEAKNGLTQGVGQNAVPFLFVFIIECSGVKNFKIVLNEVFILL